MYVLPSEPLFLYFGTVINLFQIDFINKGFINKVPLYIYIYTVIIIITLCLQ
jgi:hypothetical protein